jgi:hypothetical protein
MPPFSVGARAPRTRKRRRFQSSALALTVGAPLGSAADVKVREKSYPPFATGTYDAHATLAREHGGPLGVRSELQRAAAFDGICRAILRR